MAADTSTPADRVQFVRGIEAGAPITFGASVANLANCTIPMPPGAAYLLGMADGTTFAQGAAHITARQTAGQSVF